MAVFKQKKTYIKRYASNNFNKKVTFSSSIKSGFGSGGKIVNDTTVHESVTDNIQKTANLTKVDYDSKIQFKSSPKVDEIKAKMELSGKEYLKVLQERAKNSDVPPKTQAEISDTILKTDIVHEVKEDSKMHDTFNGTVAENALEKDASVAVMERGIDENNPAGSEKNDNAMPIEKVKEEKQKEKSIQKSNSVRKQSKRKGKKASFGHAVAICAKIVVLAVIISIGGYYGYNYMIEQNDKNNILMQELAIKYKAEDYVLPQTPQDIASKVAEKKKEAYDKAMANAYIPERAEVPNLFKYDYVKKCYLTFDDGPSGPVTESILDTLKKYNVPATFFVVGKNVDSYPHLVKRMEAEGHSIGNHSYSHNYEYMYSGDPEFDEELIRGKSAINNALGKEYKNLLYRFPGGSFEVYKKFYIWNIESEGYQFVDWNSLTGDSEKQDPDEEYIMNTLKESTNNGTKEDIVVLLHDAGAKQITADTLSKVIEYLKSKNYVFEAVKNSNFLQ